MPLRGDRARRSEGRFKPRNPVMISNSLSGLHRYEVLTT